MDNIRNFCIIAHIDSGKSTLADRFLELTGTVDKRQMQPQYLDKMELERERGIMIKMAPVRMLWHPTQINADDTQINADTSLLYADLTYKIRGAAFEVWNKVGPGFRESIYQKSLESELERRGINFISQPSIKIAYHDESVGRYQPDILIDDKILVELKALPFVGDTEKKQIWSYLRGSDYRLALLINFGPKRVEVERVVYGFARNQRLSASYPRSSAQVEDYILNLIDTPGHSDFSYEVSRALAAVEGVILLVDATKGIQAQTLSNLRAARRAGLKIIGAVNKIDLLRTRINADDVRINADNREEKVVGSLAKLLETKPEEIFKVSAKTGEGVNRLLAAVVERVPPPSLAGPRYTRSGGEYPLHLGAKTPLEAKLFAPPIAPAQDGGGTEASRALIFDSLYDDHKGIIAFVRVFGGEFSTNKEMTLLASGAKFKAKEVGYFLPEFKPSEKISEGEIGYVATGIKEPEKVRVGDTIIKSEIRNPKSETAAKALPGYKEPVPVVFISFYPDGKTKFEDLKKGIERLRLSDPALSMEPEANEALGRGLKIGFLGQLHFEIISSRLQREFNLEFLTSFPTIAYRVAVRDGADLRRFSTQINTDNIRENQRSDPRLSAVLVKQPQDFPDKPEKVWQPIISLDILSPKEYLSSIASLKNAFDLNILEVETLGENILIKAKMPLAELIRDFDDKLKSVSAGYASFSYEISGEEEADVTKLDILIVGDVIPALTRIVPQKDAEQEGRRTVERLKELLPKTQFSQSIQAKANGRIIAREDIPAMRKDVTGYLYGGDRSRKMKLWKKQQRGKEKLKSMARVEISPETFREILKK